MLACRVSVLNTCAIALLQSAGWLSRQLRVRFSTSDCAFHNLFKIYERGVNFTTWVQFPRLVV